MQEFISNFQRKHGKKVPLLKIYRDEDSSDSKGLELVDGTRVGRKATGPKPGRSSKRGRDDDDDDDDPNKRRKTGDPSKTLKPPVVRKEPRKGQPVYGGQYIGPGMRQGVVYPPIDRNLAPLYMSKPKERTQLGFHTLDWTKAQLEKITRQG